ncbi:molybdopterin cofactor-binding domain-containing protein [Chryseolinea sp. T2]|uniref:xanthine dehydrogenase family protein molybdopterin-binding subunit n=1 Tax=Chryseolinea sp. T2 TaxID=3129255 RepID=UPI0030777F0C
MKEHNITQSLTESMQITTELEKSVVLQEPNEFSVVKSTGIRQCAAIRRRSFLKIMGGGLAVLFTAVNVHGEGGVTLAEDSELESWIHIGANGQITVLTGKAEVGQNIRTSLAQIVAEELDVPMESIEMIMGDTALTPFDRGTFGSRSIPYMGPQLRKAAATARQHLLELAARKWKVNTESLTTEDGKVIHASSKQSATFGSLTEGKKMLERIREDIAVKPVSKWSIAGKSISKVRGETFITGKHRYVSDMRLPDMLYGKVLRPASYGSRLVSIDYSAAEAIPGVKVFRDGDFVGVCAPSHRVADRAARLIKAQWSTVSAQPSHENIFNYLKSKQEAAGKAVPSSLNAAFAKAPVSIDKSFTVDYIAHAPLEPRAGLAQWSNDLLTVWTGTQRPFGVQEDLAEVFQVPKEKIRVIMPDTGSGYGGKHSGEAGIEAAILAKASGKAVKVVWTREEEFTWAYFRPAGVIDVKASASNDGKLLSWEFHNYNSGPSGIEAPYEVAERHTQYHACESPLRQGSYRGLASTANTFARECIIDDLSRQLKLDPLKFRLQNLTNERIIAVLNAAAKDFNWSGWKPAPNSGIGIGCGEEKGSVVATCAEVRTDADSGLARVVRVSVAFECGAIINPSHLENQIVGSVIQGLGGAMFESISFREGKILNPSFSTYRVPRFSDIPKISVIMVDRKDRTPAGAGETPIIGIAPAIRNAMLNATGKPIYSLPMQRDMSE